MPYRQVKSIVCYNDRICNARWHNDIACQDYGNRDKQVCRLSIGSGAKIHPHGCLYTQPMIYLNALFSMTLWSFD